MYRRYFLFAIGLILICTNFFSQSIANYSVSRSTGISYNSIVSTGTPFNSWRYTGSFSQDDNRSNLTNIGFDFWYNGTKYSQFSVSTNGYIDFSSATANGGPTTGAYGYQNTQFSGAGTTPGSGGTLLSIAPFYDDMTTQGGGDPLGSSIKYELSGSAPNRILTVEWINMAVYGNTTPDLNFQVKIYETSGIIELLYGTMTPGTAGWSYTSGINAGSMSATATAAQLKVQQTANSTTFNNTETHNLATLPESDSKITFTPPTPTVPSGSLTFTGVTSSAMTLNWSNWATNEVGYAIYRSEDNVTYTYVTQTAANATSSNITGLLPATTYYWKVYAVTEGAISAAVEASQATSNAGNIVSITTGNWSAGTTWSSGSVPTSSDNVTIANGHTVTVNTNASCFNLTIGQGTSGVLTIGNNTTARIITVTGDIVVNNGATFNTNTGSNSTHNINLTGDIVNNGTLNMAADANSLANIIFNRNGNQTISGSGATMVFNRITINMGTSQNNILEVSSSNFSAASNFLAITRGTFKLSTVNAVSVTAFSGAATIPVNGRLWINNSNATVNALGTISLYGGIKVSAGTLNVGDAINENITSYGGSVEMTGGALNIAGRLDRVNNTTITSFIMSGGTLTVPTVGSTTAALAPFHMDVVGSIFTMSGGTVVIQRSGATNLGFIASDGTLNVTDGTLQIGDASTPAGQTILVNSNVALANLLINSANATAQLATALTVFNDFTISTGTFNANNLNFTLGRNWSNSGTFTPGTGTVTFNGSGNQNLTCPVGEIFYNLTINKSGGSVVLNNDAGVTNTLTHTLGNISCGSNTLTLGTSTASVGVYAYTTGVIVGKFRRWINATGTGISFPVGTTSYNRMALLTFVNLTNGSLTVEFISNDAGNNGLPLSDGGFNVADQFTEGYWNLTAADGLASTNYTIELTGAGFTSYTIKPSTRILYRINSGSAWLMNGTHADANGSTAKRTAVNGLSAQFAFGNTACSSFNVLSISGSTSVCAGTSAETYTVTSTIGNTYTWTITGGTQTGGGTTNSITVDWGGTGMVGNVQVVEQNDCGDNNTAIDLPVYVHPVATSTISGPTSVASLETGVTYSVTNIPGYTYNWTITGGTQASGGTTNSITVDWGASNPSANVSLTVTRLCGGDDVVDLPVIVRATIVSSGSGNWTSGATWVGGVAPAAFDFVQIASGHIVTMDGNQGSCTKLTIDGTADWTAAYTTNVGAGGITINPTGDISGNVAGILTSTGGLTLNTNLTSTSVGLVLQTTDDQAISGTGSLAKLTVNAAATNNGILTITGTLGGSSTLTNGSNATLNINASNFTLTELDASSSGNTVNYGASSGQTIKGATYHHLSASGGGTKTLSGNIIVNGNLDIAGVTLDISASNCLINIAGDWNNTGTFQPRFGTVVFDGSASQNLTKNGGETFNNITFDGSGSTTLNNDISVNVDMSINSGTILAGSNLITIDGNWSNSGTFSGETGTVIFNGSSPQTINGSSPTDFNNLTISSGSQVSLSSAQRLMGTLMLNGTATFNTNNQLTLVSTASNTANIGTLGTPGNFTGDITMQRYVSGGQGYRYIGSAISNATLNDLTPEIRFDGFPGSTQPSWWCNAYTYDESATGAFANGWVAPSNITDPMLSGKGFAVYFYSTNIPVTFDLSGPINKGNISLPVSYTSSPDIDDGYNLVSNPYPSTIDWDAASGWTRTNIQGNTFYTWNDASQNYASYPLGGPGTNGGTNYIASSQGFVVKGSSATPVLDMTENVKTTINPTPQFWKTSNNVLYAIKLNLTNNINTYSDETVIRFREGATNNKDIDYDALKIISSNAASPYLASVSNDSISLCINSYDYLSDELNIPIEIMAGVTGSYTLKSELINNFPAEACLMLEDLSTGITTDLKNNASYTFTLATTSAPEKRFILHVYPPLVILESNDANCYGENSGSIIISGSNQQAWSYTVIDDEGGFVAGQSGITQSDTVFNLNAGVYFVMSSNLSAFCNSETDTVVIFEPPAISIAAGGTDITCKGMNDGTATVMVLGGSGAYSFLWSNGTTSQNLSNLPAGNYYCTVKDENLCYATDSIVINEGPQTVQADFTLSSDTIYLSNGGSVSLTNTSIGASSYYWTFENNAYSTDQDPFYTYIDTGEYYIQLMAFGNDGCKDSITHKIVVLQQEIISFISEETLKNNLLVYSADHLLKIVWSLPNTIQTSMSILNMLGQEVFRNENINLSASSRYELNTETFVEGIYIVSISNRYGQVIKKINFN